MKGSRNLELVEGSARGSAQWPGAGAVGGAGAGGGGVRVGIRTVLRLERRLCGVGQNSLARVKMSNLKVIWVLT